MSALKLALLTTKIVYSVRLLKSGTVFTIARRDGTTYMGVQIKELYSEKMLRCQDFRPKSGLLGSLKKPTRVSRVISTSRVPTNVGSSDPSRDFQ
jgi:hypothetical protein